ncbi:MAG TPA: RICIN domain-containing protein [Kofleriaceae bacterium]
MTLDGLQVRFHTNDEDKDGDSGLIAAIDGYASWSQTSDNHYDDFSTHVWPLDRSSIRMADLAGRYVSVCMKPNGDDTWKFDFDLLGSRSDGVPYTFHKENVFLSTDVPCLSWDATPPATPTGRIGALGRCLSPAGGGTTIGTRIVIDDCRADGSQRWIFAPGGEIRHSSGLCLDLPGADPSDGNQLQLWDCNGTVAQRWQVSPAGAIHGFFDKCVDVAGGNSAAGTPVQLLTCNGGAGQFFSLPRCGAQGQICCANSAPCRDPANACEAGVCTVAPVTIDNLQVTFLTENEDKDDDTQVRLDGPVSYVQSGNQHYDDWSTRSYPLAPGSLAVSDLLHNPTTLTIAPNGNDSWKVAFMLAGTRSDGGVFQFRRDNLWVTQDTRTVTWRLDQNPLDLVWSPDQVDPNGFPLNPTWAGWTAGGGFDDAGILSPEGTCAFTGNPLAGDLNNWGRCTTQSVTYDRSNICGWHVNWFAAAFDGEAQWADRSDGIFDDDDYNIDLAPRDLHSLAGRGMLHTEFDFGETVEQFGGQWWGHLRALVEGNIIAPDLINEQVGGYTFMIGLTGFDTVHGVHAEIHPVYVYAHRAVDSVDGNGDHDETWAIFVRNFGNEGGCGGSQHFLGLTRFTLFLPRPGGISVQETFSDFWTNYGAAQVSGVVPWKEGAAITFVIGPPEQRTFINGELRLHWTVAAPAPVAAAQPAARRSPAIETESEIFPDVRMTPAQLAQLKVAVDQWPPSEPARATLRPARVPFAWPAPGPGIVGRGPPAVHSVVDTAKTRRDEALRNFVCKVASDTGQRPESCRAK